ncbi:MAG: 30S ribosomal protein S8 [Candidatus Omnitrophica bacterium]|nr:30S ribosomal protein S8 [Candidatus Omnitrophota bacterium]
MSRTDLVADAFTMIRNAVMARKEDTLLPYSKVLLKICEILKKEGYLENFKEIDLENFKNIKVYLKYDGKKNVINGIQKVSKPGRRIYVKKEKIPSVLRGYGIALISTSANILTDKEAKAKGIGGEYIGKVW